jgi:hypothetical protein
MAKDEWKLVGPDDMVLQQYPCGVMAGEGLRLRRDIVVQDHKGQPTGEVHREGGIWNILTGNPSEPNTVWLRQPDGHMHTWTSDDLLEWFERLPNE